MGLDMGKALLTETDYTDYIEKCHSANTSRHVTSRQCTQMYPLE